MRCLLPALLLAACATERPVHPMRLDGFPGAPIEPGLFELRPGARWVFRDRLDPDRPPLEMAIRRRGEAFVLTGGTEAEAFISLAGGFVEISFQGNVVERPLKLKGAVGDSWRVGNATCTAFGYDRIEVLGERRRALVVAVDRPPVRDLYWFARGMGWVRIRSERDGSAFKDAVLVEHDPGRAN